MTIKEALDFIKSYKKNDYIKGTTAEGLAQGIKWLNAIETEIYNNIILTHEYNEGETEITFEGYDTTTPDSTEMIVPTPYDDLYTYYLMSQIDYLNREMQSYDNNIQQYSALRDEFENRYNYSQDQSGNDICTYRRLRSMQDAPGF